MLQRQRQVLGQAQKVLDAVLYGLAFWWAYSLRDTRAFSALFGRPDIRDFLAEYVWMLVIVPVAPIFLQLQGYYARPLVDSRRRSWSQILLATLWITVTLVLVSFLIRAQPARGVIILFGAFGVILLMLKDELLRAWVRSRVGRAQFQKRLLLIGTEADRRSLRQRLMRESRESVQILAEADINEVRVERMVDLMHEHSVNGVLLSAKHTYFGQVEKVIAACELEGIEVWLMADFFKTQISQTSLDDFHGLPMLVFRSTPEASWQVLAKQVIDTTGALVLLLLASPVLVAAAIAVKVTSPGPVLFRQQRCGLNGRPFTMVKFRSMTTDAEQRKHEIERLNEMTGPVFKVTNDPRITPVGRFLRKYSIDEFPQLLNVLQGDMSLVGPRPLPVDEVARFDDLAHRRRLSVKPGITCLWQVSGRNNVTDFKEWVRLDLEYIDNWTLWLDMQILCRTIPVVMLGTGAK